MADRYTQSQFDSYMKPVTSLVLELDPLLNKIPKKYNLSGDRLTKDYTVDNHGLKSYGRGATHVATEKGDYIRAIWPWAGVYDDDYVYGWDKESQGAEGSLSTGTLRKIRDEMIVRMRENFVQRFREIIWDGDGTSLNGGTGVQPLGITQAVSQTPSSGTYAGLSRVTYTGWRNRQISGTAGPSTNWAQDVWERILTLKTLTARTPMTVDQPRDADMLFTNFTNYVDVVNRALTQNVVIGTNVQELQSVLGLKIHQSENVGANLVYLLNSQSMEWSTTHPQGVMFRLHYKKDLEDHVDENDEVMVMRARGQLRVHFPAANGVITSA